MRYSLYEYAVFLSFRGEEVRKTFLSHLLYSLDRKGIRSVTSTATYHPNNRAAVDSLVSICIISKNFTSLDWWVEESAKIIACKKKAVPVFLGVDPLDVLRVLNLAEDSVGINEARRNTLEVVKNWLDGHVTSKSGFNSSDWEDDSQLVDKLTCFVSDTVTQDSISNRWCPRINWLESPWYEDYELNSLLSSTSSLLHSSKPSEITSGLYSMGDRNTSSGRFQTTGTGTIYSKATDSPPLLTASSSYRSPSIPFMHPSRPSETAIKSSWWNNLITKIPFLNPSKFTESLRDFIHMNPFAEHSVIDEASSCDIRIMRHRAEEVLLLLRLGDSTNELLSIGIYGMEGVGKTTLAEDVYEEISPQFQYHFFITNFSQKGSSLHEILASETLNASSGRSDVIEEILGRNVLLVVDNVDDIKQLKGFAKEVSLFGPGSRIIVITQDMSLLVQCGVKDIYQVRCPEYDEAIQLFSQFAFKQTNPASGFESFSRRAVDVAGRVPLALKVLGSYLYGRDEYEWESTLLRLEESLNNYATTEVLKYIIAETPTIIELDENEENRFPLYSFTLH